VRDPQVGGGDQVAQHARAGWHQREQGEVERRVEIDGKPMATRQLGDHDTTLGEPARQDVVVDHAAQAPQKDRVGHGQDVGGVATVGQRRWSGTPGRRRQALGIVCSEERHGPRAEQHQPALG
jgi:hypothetical protein